MDNIMECKVVHESTKEQFELKVNECFKDGWNMSGSMNTVVIQNNDTVEFSIMLTRFNNC